MSEVQAYIFAAFLYFLAGLFVFAMVKPHFRPREKQEGGTFESYSGRTYEYRQGEDLHANLTFGHFNGLEVLLPVALPHIYLDSRKAGGLRVSAVLDERQLLQLEGDFNDYFNVFVPEPYADTALSILTPDVMLTLCEHAQTVDVEFYGSYLRIITDKPVRGDEQVQLELRSVALKILKEIEDKQRSWPTHNSEASYDQDLWVSQTSGIRLYGRYIRWRMVLIGFFWFLCTVPFLLLSLIMLQDARYFAALALVLAYGGFAVGLRQFARVNERATDFKSRSGRNRVP